MTRVTKGKKKLKLQLIITGRFSAGERKKSLLLIKETKLGDGGIICKLKYTEDDPLCEGWCIK